MPTQSGDLTKEELLSIGLHVRQDSTFIHLDAEAMIDGRSVTANVGRVRRSVRKPSFSRNVGQIAEAIQGAYESAGEQGAYESAGEQTENEQDETTVNPL